MRTRASATRASRVVVSVSLWGDNPKYEKGAVALVAQTRAFTPYEVWVHVDKSVRPPTRALLTRVGARVVDCSHMAHLQNSATNPRAGALWRYAPMADPTVDVVIVHDVDNVCETHMLLQWVSMSTTKSVLFPWYDRFSDKPLEPFERRRMVEGRYLLANMVVRWPLAADIMTYADAFARTHALVYGTDEQFVTRYMATRATLDNTYFVHLLLNSSGGNMEAD